MAGPVICDAGPLIAFASADLLEVLNRLFPRVLVPPAVRDECLAGTHADRACIEQVLQEGWLALRTPATPAPTMPVHLGAGECAVLHLGLELPGALLILDDRLARRHARHLGLSFVGTARLLLVAEQRGLLKDAETALRQMRENGYRLPPELLERLRGHPNPGG